MTLLPSTRRPSRVLEAPEELPAPLGPRAAGDRKVLLLGPQRKKPNLAAVLEKHGIRGRLAVVSAGLQEREGEIDALEPLGTRATDLRLHARADVMFTSHPELARAHRARQELLRTLRRLYDLRLAHAAAALTELERRGGPPEAIEWERREALEDLRRLDAHHLARVRELHAEWEPRLDLANRPAVVHHRAEVRAIVRASDALVVAGGHVAILANRLRFFEIFFALRPDQPVIAWSGGAMALTERIIVYHDSPPWGPGNPEAFDLGLGLARDVVALPDARRRLKLDDPARVGRFAHRFGPSACIALEEGDTLELSATGFRASEGMKQLSIDGSLLELAP